MNIGNKTILITGANRGIGRALLDEALRHGAKKVYAGTRSALQHSDKRVTPLTLDVTNSAQIKGAIERVETLDILINNAKVNFFDDLSDRAALERDLAVNFFGTYGVTRPSYPFV
jgi:NAD(P)-dependent dehydrogenase (short-subunit alcohol dehydrogenase family)